MKKVLLVLVLIVGVNTFLQYEQLTLAEGRAICELFLHERTTGDLGRQSDLSYRNCIEKYHWYVSRI